ncbi:hypothetical protein PybrP1_005131 [[Pythium] brassicae (nom. inval.)]|nr:hypothetical protein PybrP1_005131 [[Pythium] brassicae (nom. inval.)]
MAHPAAAELTDAPTGACVSPRGCGPPRPLAPPSPSRATRLESARRSIRLGKELRARAAVEIDAALRTRDLLLRHEHWHAAVQPGFDVRVAREHDLALAALSLFRHERAVQIRCERLAIPRREVAQRLEVAHGVLARRPL